MFYFVDKEEDYDSELDLDEDTVYDINPEDSYSWDYDSFGYDD